MGVLSFILLQLEGIGAGAEPPSHYDWWEGLLYFSGLSLVGLIVKVGEKFLDRSNARSVAGGSLKRQIGELKELLENGDLTREEFDTQKQAILNRKMTTENA